MRSTFCRRTTSRITCKLFADAVGLKRSVLRRGFSIKKGGLGFVKRRAQREQAFLLVFEKSFDDCDSKPKPRMSYFGNGETHEFTERVFTGVKEHEEEINKTINESIVGWDKDRLSRIVICILRIAVYEMFFEESVPISVSINEAVEIAKKYGTDKSSSFVNGVLGIIAVRLESGNHKKLNKRKLG